MKHRFKRDSASGNNYLRFYRVKKLIFWYERQKRKYAHSEEIEHWCWQRSGLRHLGRWTRVSFVIELRIICTYNMPRICATKRIQFFPSTKVHLFSGRSTYYILSAQRWPHVVAWVTRNSGSNILAHDSVSSSSRQLLEVLELPGYDINIPFDIVGVAQDV